MKGDILSDVKVESLEISTGIDIVFEGEHVDLLCAAETVDCSRGDECGDGLFDDLD